MKKKKAKKSAPFRKHIALTIAVISLLPCIALSGIILKVLYPQWVRSSLEKQYSSIEYTSLSLNEQIVEMTQKMQYILFDTTIRPYITQIEDLKLIYQLDLLEQLDETADALTVANPDMSIRWYPYSCEKSFGSNCLPLEVLSQEFQAQDNPRELQKILSLADGKTYWTVRHISRSINNKGAPEERLCLYSQLTSSRNSNCVLEITAPISQLYNSSDYEEIENSLFAFYQNSDTDSWSIVFDSSLTSSQITSLFDSYQSGRNHPGYYTLTMEVPNVSGGVVLLFIPNSYVRALLLPYLLVFFGIILLVITLIVITGYMASHILTRRVITLIDRINNNLDSYFSDTAQRDFTTGSITHISERIEQLIQNTQMYCNQVEYYETENARMEPELLQMRFNPHLLYNTLSTLKYHVTDPVFQQTIDALCKYYRIILSNGHLLVRVTDELEMIEQYLFVMKSAYGLSNIEYKSEVDDALSNCAVIKHILQPIVENAINHGLKPLKKPGLLTIQAYLDHEDVVIDVTDNGIGMSQETIGKLITEPLPFSFSGGYGIYNVQQRIQLYYGEEYGLTIKSQIGQGTSVRIRIPVQMDGL